jgi:hypothetical protein
MGNLRERAHRGALSVGITLLAVVAPGSGRAQHAHAAHLAPVARVPEATLATQLVSDGGAFTVELDTSPQPIRLNEYFELLIVVQPASPDSQRPVSVDVTAEMPAHRHGMNTRPQREQLSDGRFVFRGLLFHMAGEWQLTIEIAQGRVRERATARLVIE